MTPLSPKPLSADQLQRLDNLIALDSARLQALERDLQCFRDLILPRPEALRRELLGYAEEQRARLTDTQR